MITLEDLNLSKEDMEKIAAGARLYLAPEEVHETDVDFDDTPPEDIEEPPEIEEGPSDLVTRRNLRE